MLLSRRSLASPVATIPAKRSCSTLYATKRDLILSSGLILPSSLAFGGSARAEDTEAETPPADRVSSTTPRKRKRRPKPEPKTLDPTEPIPRVQLAEGLEISQVVRGCWQLDGQHRGDELSDRTTGAAALQDLEKCLAAGVTTFDTADNYGPSETMVGRFLRLNPRNMEQAVVLTKISFMGTPELEQLKSDILEYRVRAACTRLGVSSLPLLQLHWEDFRAKGYLDVARHLVDLKERGLVQHFGVANWDVPRLVQLLDKGIVPVSNQVAYSVMDRRPQLFLSSFCERHDISLLAYGVFGGGFLADRYLGMPPAKARLDTISKAKYGTLLQELGGWGWLQDMLPVLKKVASKHGVSISAVAARWVIQQQQVAAVILGARNGSHLRDWQTLFSFSLDDIDMLDIDAAYEGATIPTGDVYAWERGGNW